LISGVGPVRIMELAAETYGSLLRIAEQLR